MTDTGLTGAQVQERIRKGQVNTRTQTGTKTVKEILRENLLTYFNMIFVLLGILLLIARSYRDLTFIFVIAANALIGIVQELHSKKVLDRMNLMTQPHVTVIRDGEEKEIATEKIVVDDLMKLRSGMQIPADCSVVQGDLHVNESMLTGEADEIEKKAGDQLLSGSFIVSGNCMARAKQVGEQAYASRLAQEATTMQSGEQSEIFRALNRMLLFFGVLIIPLGTILFVQQFVFAKAGFGASVTGMVAALIGMIPEGIYLLTSVALAVSAVRLTGKKVLVHDLKCIETLARVDMLCVDKTGTITEKEMHVVSFDVLTAQRNSKQVQQLLADFAQSTQDGNDTMAALQEYFTETGGMLAQEVTPFSSRYKYSAETIGGRHFVLGAPEFVLGGCLDACADKLQAYSAQGCRVLAFAEYPTLPHGEKLGGAGEKMVDGGAVQGNGIPENAVPGNAVQPLALIALENPIRKGAVKTFRYFAQQKVCIKVISGDNPATVSRVAAKAGIRHADSFIDVSRIRTQSGLEKAALQYTVFGRVSPQQKKQLVIALQKAGHTVAMTGDGVNDIIAMKEADCSVAMASGSEAAAQASQLVLLDSDFGRMPSIVEEGRRVVNNIQRAASLYLVKNIFSLLMAIFSVILMLNYPLEPSQISLISLFTIGIPSFLLALEPNHERIHGHFMSNVIIRALPAGITDFLTVSALVVFCNEFKVDPACVSTSCSILVAIVGFMILYRIMKPARAMHHIMLVCVILGWVLCLLQFSSFFGITALSRQCAMLMVVFAITTEPILRYLSEWTRRIFCHYRANSVR